MNCRVCNRPLRSADSVARGTGPVCSGHVGRGERPGTGEQPELFEELEELPKQAIKQSLTTDVIDWDRLRGLKVDGNGETC